jgi:3-dehydroquinate dehydratase / shikimate dehydrogenase
MNERVRVCVPVCAKSVAELEEQYQRAQQVGDIVELRLDCLEQLPERFNKLTGPTILTLRPSEQGGYRTLNRAEREAFWRNHLEAKSLCDIELDLAANSTMEFDWSRVIASHHDFTRVPHDLNQIYEQLAATPARILKIAVQANDITDCLPVFQLLERARNEGREIIAIAMGDAGIVTRVLGPARGSFLTYGSLADETATAPGQVNARQLRSLYRIDEIDQDTMICGLVGLPVMHSVSPHMHNAAFAAEGVNGVYLPFEVRNLSAFMKRMVKPETLALEWNLRGLSVTAPHKSDVIQFLDWIEPEAQQIGAVNTVVIKDGELRGYNTDVYGLVEPLLKVVGSLKELRVAVIGAGGAARAAVWAMNQHAARVTVFARDVVKARSLHPECQELANASFSDYDVVINATPVSPAVAEQLARASLVYDLIYNPIETGFLKEARRAGCQTLGGLEMLVAQARLQFELWTGKQPTASIMHDAAAAALGQ